MKVTTITTQQQHDEYVATLHTMREANENHPLAMKFRPDRDRIIRQLYKVINEWNHRKPEPVIERKQYLKKQKNAKANG